MPEDLALPLDLLKEHGPLGLLAVVLAIVIAAAKKGRIPALTRVPVAARPWLLLALGALAAGIEAVARGASRQAALGKGVSAIVLASAVHLLMHEKAKEPGPPVPGGAS